MASLFRIFCIFILKVTVIFTVGSIIGILALDKLFGGYEFYLGMLVFIAPIIAWTMTFMLVPKNLDWIMALPISKRNVLVLHYLTSVFASVAIFFASIFILIVLTLIKAENQLKFDNLAKSAATAASDAQVGTQFGNYIAGIDIYGWMTGLLMISFFHALSMSISRPTTTKRLYLNVLNHANKYIRWGSRTGWIFIIAAAAYFREYVFSPFGIFVLATVIFLFFTTVNTTHALGIARAQRRRWLVVSGLVAMVQIIFLFTNAMLGVNSASFDRRVASVMFLGPFSGGMAKADLARLLEAGVNAERVKELGEYYIKAHAHDKKIRLSNDHDIDFGRAVGSKKTFSDVISTIGLFDPSDFGLGEVRLIFEKLQPLMVENRTDYPGYELLAAKVESSGVLELLRSKNEAAIQYALLRARYHRDASFIPVIQRDLPLYSDKVKMLALRTLSLLHGRHFTLDDWIQTRAGGRRISSSFYTIDCAGWKPKAVNDFKIEDAPALNVCIREKAEQAHIAQIEAAGWMEPPFDLKTQATIRKIFHVK